MNCRRVYDRAGVRVKPPANRDDMRVFVASASTTVSAAFRDAHR
ncbi:hypothetical protein [Burkholderia ambifaria]